MALVSELFSLPSDSLQLRLKKISATVLSSTAQHQISSKGNLMTGSNSAAQQNSLVFYTLRRAMQTHQNLFLFLNLLDIKIILPCCLPCKESNLLWHHHFIFHSLPKLYFTHIRLSHVVWFNGVHPWVWPPAHHPIFSLFIYFFTVSWKNV